MATPIVAQEPQIISRSQALKRGLARYFTGKPCKHGHISERFTAQGRCYECTQTPEHKALVSKIGKAWSAGNPEKKKAMRDAWSRDNADRKKATNRAWYEANREQEIKRRRRDYESNKSEWIAKVSAWAKANPEKRAAQKSRWAKNNRPKMSAWTALWRATKRQATPAWANLDVIREIYQEAKRVSDETGIPHHVDHIVPLISDIVCGLHCEANLRVLEGAENCSKANRYWPDMP